MPVLAVFEDGMYELIGDNEDAWLAYQVLKNTNLNVMGALSDETVQNSIEAIALGQGLSQAEAETYATTVYAASALIGNGKRKVVDGNNSGTKYAPTAKHLKGGWGTEMDLSDGVAQDVLNSSLQGGKQKYGYHDGKIYEFQPDNQGGWHGYPIKGTEAPPSVLKEMKQRGDFGNAEYKKLIKGK